MKTLHSIEARVLFMVVLAMLMVAWSHNPVGAKTTEAAPLSAGDSSQGGPVIETFPAPGVLDPPFYANFAANFMPSDDGIVGIAFYRQPSCIPADYNLLVRFAGPSAFSCELTVRGKRWWHDPATDPFPFQIRIWGLGAVPI